MILLGYWDLTNPPKQGYQRFPHRADTQMLSQEVLPGAFGFPDLYTRHIHFTDGRQEVLIICQTEKELTDDDRAAISAGAIVFLRLPPDEPHDA